jgi:hypothetical protein
MFGRRLEPPDGLGMVSGRRISDGAQESGVTIPMGRTAPFIAGGDAVTTRTLGVVECRQLPPGALEAAREITRVEHERMRHEWRPSGVSRRTSARAQLDDRLRRLGIRVPG